MQENEGQLTLSIHHQIITTIHHPPRQCTDPRRTLKSEPKSVVKVDIEESRRLGDGDLARFALLVLGNDNGEHAVLHGSSDVVLIDTSWERKAATKFSNTALRDPKLGLGLVGLCGLLLLGDLGGSALSSSLILDASLVSLVVVCTFDGTFGRSVLDEAGRGSAGGVGALGAAFDGQGVGISEFDLDILLLDPREFAVELVGVLDFLDVELGGEGLQGGAGVAVALTAVLIEVVEHAEEWLEGVGRVGGEE